MYPETEPYDQGMLDVGDGNLVYWEVCGNPDGKPAVAVHGGPGSGCGPFWRRYFDPDVYRVVLFDQRGCGRSTPHASDPATDLATNTTHHLIADIELLRRHLGIERWLVFGGSWGSTLGLAYAERHPSRVSELILFLVALTQPRDVEWITRHVGRLFPEDWARFRDGVPPEERDGDLAAAYARLVNSPDATVREKAARGWCEWEDSLVQLGPERRHDSRYDDPVFRMAFVRLVTHYFSNHAFLKDGVLLRDAGRLAGIPGDLAHGRLDLGSPLENAWLLAQAWPDAELFIVDDAGHAAGDASMAEVLVAATDKFSELAS